MDNAASGRHPVDLTGNDDLVVTETVAVSNGARKQVRDCGQADVRMGPHVNATARWKISRSDVVKKNEWADALLRPLWESSPNVELSQAPDAGCNYPCDMLCRESCHYSGLMNLSVIRSDSPIARYFSRSVSPSSSDGGNVHTPSG